MLGNKGYLFSAGHLHSDKKIAHCKAEKLKLIKIKAREDIKAGEGVIHGCQTVAGNGGFYNYLFPAK
jgi:hypothetical protein